MKRVIKFIMSKAFSIYLGCLALIINASWVVAVENMQSSFDHVSNASDVYACNIIHYSNQCREYEILDGAKTTLEDIKSGCESMKGSFLNNVCPTENLLAVCSDIIRNYHQPDMIYSNHYYLSKTSIWTIDLVEDVCGDLGGEFLIPKKQ